MSHMNSIAARHNAYTPPIAVATKLGGDESVPMTVEELLLKCQQTIENLDQQLRNKLGEQEARNEKLKELSSISQEINALGPAPVSDDATVVTAWQTKRQAIDAKLESMSGQYAEGFTDGIKACIGSADGNKNATTNLDQEMDKIRTENETSMIQIQSIISKRAQALQMTSNMVNSFNESSKALIQNIR